MSGIWRLMLLVAFGTVSAVGIVGVVLYWEFAPKAAAIVPSQPAPDEPLRLPDRPIKAFALKVQAPESAVLGALVHPGLLGRELMRQAWLIAARDEMGLDTRDATIGDHIDDSAEGAMDARTQNIVGGATSGELTFVDKSISNWKTNWSEPLKPQPTALDYVELATLFEKKSRTTFVDELTKARFEQGGKPKRSSKELPAEVERDLRRMSPLSQFVAVRRIHQIIRSEGESEALLAGLARGYANLGVLTHPLWMSETTAYSARALLYSQRLIAGWPDLPSAYWTRAYVLAMLGIDRQALDDLKQADSLHTKAQEQPPDWVEMIDRQCRYDHKALAKLASDAPEADLPAFLYFRALMGDASKSKASVQLAVDQMTKRHAECPPIMHSAAICGSIGIMRTSTQATLDALPGAVAQHVKMLDHVDESVKQAADSETPLSTVPQALRDTNKANATPSNQALARLIEEMALLATFDRAKFMARIWSVSTDEVFEEMAPAYADHPWRSLVQLAVLNPYQEPAAVAELVRECRLFDERGPLQEEVGNLRDQGGAEQHLANQLHSNALAHADDLTNDVKIMISSLNPIYAMHSISGWEYASPDCPLLLAEKWRSDPKWGAAQSQEMFDRLSRHPASSQTLAHAMIRHKDDRAIEALQRFRPMDQSNWATEALADIYRAKGDMVKWRESLDEYLKEPDQHLDHAEARCHIAKYLMSQGNFDEAWEYASKAAETGAQWAMMTAAYAAEGREDWEAAEDLITQTVDAYPHQLMNWYLWCKRTGHGNIEAARKIADRFRARINLDNSDIFATNRYAVIDQVDGKLAEANVAWERGFETAASAYSGLMVAMNHDELGAKDARDEWLTRIVEQADHPESEQEKKLAGLMLEDVRGKAEALTDESIEALAKEASDEDESAVYYFAGRYFVNKGDKERGRKLLKRSRDLFYVDRWASALAGVLLHEMENAEPKS